MFVFKKISNFFKPPAKKEIFSDNLKMINKKFVILRNQIFGFSILTYILYYFTRKSYELGGSAMVLGGVISADMYAIIGLVFALVYGGAKFIVGNIADRSSGRIIMIFGLFISAILNIALGGVIALSGTSLHIGAFVMMLVMIAMLAIFQGMGWPATARIFSHWFSDKERSGRIGWWNSGKTLVLLFYQLLLLV